MGYRKISNLYQNKDILLFKQAYALEKVHGTSAHVRYKPAYEEKVDSKVGDGSFYLRQVPDKIIFFSGGANHEQFVALFDEAALLEKFRENAKNFSGADITFYGEAYGGKMQGMSETYGKELRFIVFEVLINDDWFSVPRAHAFAEKFGFEFVPYKIIDTTEDAINAEMMADSEVAVRRGAGTGRMREGIVLRPLVELVHPNGGRIICKHKRPEFAEREHTPKFSDPEQLKVLEDAKEIAQEFCTAMRLVHVLDKFIDPKIEDANKIIKAMVEDISIEAKGEIVENKEVRKQIGKKTMVLFKEYLMNKKD